MAESSDLLNKSLPVYRFSEKHECVIDAAAKKVMEKVANFTPAVFCTNNSARMEFTPYRHLIRLCSGMLRVRTLKMIKHATENGFSD